MEPLKLTAEHIAKINKMLTAMFADHMTFDAHQGIVKSDSTDIYWYEFCMGYLMYRIYKGIHLYGHKYTKEDFKVYWAETGEFLISTAKYQMLLTMGKTEKAAEYKHPVDFLFDLHIKYIESKSPDEISSDTAVFIDEHRFM